MIKLFFNQNKILISVLLFGILFSNNRNCDDGYMEINDLCFYQQDIDVLQSFIDNSYSSGIDLGCSDNDGWYCGSPNPQMDSIDDGWYWNVVDSVSYTFVNGNGIVEPLELGIQEWQNGRLKSLMCGAYIYCELSGEIPANINNLTEINQFRIEYNYLSGHVPESICELGLNDDDYLEFDLTGNNLCPPYPECIENGIGYQDPENCYSLGDINYDGFIDVIDIVEIVGIILNGDFNANADMNSDSILNVQDIIIVVDLIIN